MADAEAQVAGLFARYEPAVAKLGGALRSHLRARLPGLTEVVYMYEGQENLVISYSPSGRGFEGVCSMSVRPGKVALYFTKGGEVARADSGKLLQGSGKGVRHVVVNAAADIQNPGIESLMAAALKFAKVSPVPGAKGEIILKVEEQKKRASRTAKSRR